MATNILRWAGMLVPTPRHGADALAWLVVCSSTVFLEAFGRPRERLVRRIHAANCMPRVDAVVQAHPRMRLSSFRSGGRYLPDTFPQKSQQATRCRKYGTVATPPCTFTPFAAGHDMWRTDDPRDVHPARQTSIMAATGWASAIEPPPQHATPNHECVPDATGSIATSGKCFN